MVIASNGPWQFLRKLTLMQNAAQSSSFGL